MYPEIEYEMTQSDLDKIMDACKPVPMIMLQCGTPRSPQERANDAWKELGARMGFDHMTVRPVNGKGNRCFTAVPSETPTQRKTTVAELIADNERRLVALTAPPPEPIECLGGAVLDNE